MNNKLLGWITGVICAACVIGSFMLARQGKPIDRIVEEQRMWVTNYESKVAKHADRVAELSYLEGFNDGMKMAKELRQCLYLKPEDALAMATQRRTNWLATRPGRLTP